MGGAAKRNSRPVSGTAAPADKAGLLKAAGRETADWSEPPPHGRRRIVLRFHSTAEAILGDAQVRGLRVTGPDGTVELATGQVVRAIGHRGTPLPGLPFDEDTGTIPNNAGRVAAGTYVVGWVKRGPAGGIGANKACARETVRTLLADLTG